MGLVRLLSSISWLVIDIANTDDCCRHHFLASHDCLSLHSLFFCGPRSRFSLNMGNILSFGLSRKGEKKEDVGLHMVIAHVSDFMLCRSLIEVQCHIMD